MPKDARDYVISHWPLTFLSGDAPGYVKNDGSNLAASSSAAKAAMISGLAASLNSVFDDVKVQASSNGLLIIGAKEHVRRIKTILAKWVDVPYPQVRLNVLSFQATKKSYDADKVSDAAQMANMGAAISREFLRAYVIDFAKYVGEQTSFLRDDVDPKKHPGLHELPARTNDLFGRFHLLGFKNFDGPDYETLEEGRARVKPFIDDLAYIALADPGLFKPGGDFETYMSKGKAKDLLDSLKIQFSK